MISTANLACIAIGFLLGAVALWLLGRRKTSTKAELLAALTLEAKLIAKMPGAAEAIEFAQEQAKAEGAAQAAFLAAVTKASGGSPVA